MAIRLIKNIEIKCDTCQEIIATGKTSSQTCKVLEHEEKYTKIYCTDCVKLSINKK